MNKKTAILDLTGCKYLGELHQRIKSALDFPEYYGGNWDGLWDCLNRDCDVNIVTIKGSTKVAEELKSSVITMIEIFDENKQYWANTDYPFDYEIIS
ncbi:MAG: barstar family protein [Clostridia bacterium]|nr:barstar family protein [Clostridia bacterium]